MLDIEIAVELLECFCYVRVLSTSPYKVWFADEQLLMMMMTSSSSVRSDDDVEIFQDVGAWWEMRLKSGADDDILQWPAEIRKCIFKC